MKGGRPVPESSDHDRVLGGPYGPTPDLNPALWEPMDCSRCGQPVTPDDVWYADEDVNDPDADGPVYHERCVVG